MSRTAVACLVALALAVLFVLGSTLGSRRYSCEVCVDFHDRSECRTAAGDDRTATIQMATDNACALLASGRAQLLQCGHLPPRKVECTER